MSRRDRKSILLETVEMELNSLVNQTANVVTSCGDRDAPWQIWDVGAEAGFRLFNHHEISHTSFSSEHPSTLASCLRPACFSTLLSVPAGTSADSLPATVTVPAFEGCRNCRWLPRCRTCTQPSTSSCLIRSRTLVGIRIVYAPPWFLSKSQGTSSATTAPFAPAAEVMQERSADRPKSLPSPISRAATIPPGRRVTLPDRCRCRPGRCDPAAVGGVSGRWAAPRTCRGAGVRRVRPQSLRPGAA